MTVTRYLWGFIPYKTVHPKPHLRSCEGLWICFDRAEPGIDGIGAAYAGNSPRAAWNEWARWSLV